MYLRSHLDCATVVDLLRFRAENDGARTVYVFLSADEKETVVSFADLFVVSLRAANTISSYVGAGERVLLLCPPGFEYVAALFGTFLAGAVAVPAYPPHRRRGLSRLEAIIKDCDPAALIVTSQVHRQIGNLDYLTDGGRRRIITIDRDCPYNTKWSPPQINSSALAVIQYTSGSTSTPRGVTLTHDNILANSAAICHAFETDRDTVSASWLPLYHDMGLILSVIQPLFAGFRSILMPSASFVHQPYRWLKVISDYRASLAGGPNFAYDLCVRRVTEKQKASLALGSWRIAFNGAEPVRSGTMVQFARAFADSGFGAGTFFPAYGLAEATLLVSAPTVGAGFTARWFDSEALEQHRLSDAAGGVDGARQIVSCGRAVNQRIRIVDPETQSVCGEGYIGEIWVAGDSVSAGYWNGGRESGQVFGARLTGDNNSYLRTGDLGALVLSELFVTGRLKDLIVIEGRNIYPQDAEFIAEQASSRVRAGRTAAFAIDVDGREAVAIVCELDSRHPTNLDAVLAAVRDAITLELTVPVSRVALIRFGSMPITSSGKIQRSTCRSLLTNGRLDIVAEWKSQIDGSFAAVDAVSRTGTPMSTTEIKEWLISRLVEDLNIERSAIHSDRELAAFGIGSIDAVALLAKLADRLGREVPATLIWNCPTIDLIARHLADGDKSDAADASIRFETFADDAIAIVGIGCKFPGAESAEEFWWLLREGLAAITEVPRQRWDVEAWYSPKAGTAGKTNSRWGGFVANADCFDAAFFGIPPCEAEQMDSQQQWLLEVSWQALESAGISPSELAGSDAGVFIGISSFDSARLPTSVESCNVYTATGNAHSIAANRLSYFYDIHGPSTSIDTACSSSLVAVHLACEALRSRECSLALAGGVNLLLDPQLTVALSQANMLAHDGRCKTFDATADGYVRGEGCGIVVLKPLRQAQRDGDRILARICGSATNHGGRGNGLTAPSGLWQERLIRRALVRAGIPPRLISYVEAHGTGTALGDPIEVGALQMVLAENRPPGQSCMVGSVKTNIGHLEAAAGIAGLLKVVLAVSHRAIPAHLNLGKVNPYLELKVVNIPTNLTDWQPIEGRRIAGVSSFGFGGANAFVLVEEESTPPRPPLSQRDRPLHLLALSAKTPDALRRIAERYEARLLALGNDRLSDLCYSANSGHAHFNHRLAVVGDTATSMAQSLGVFIAGRPVAGVWSGEAAMVPRPAFLFTGQSEQYYRMSRELYETNCVFRNVIDRCDARFRARGRARLRDHLFAADEGQVLDEAELAQASLFAIEAALHDLWTSWGIHPGVVIGYGIGELGAAYATGVVTLDDGLALAAERGRLMHPRVERGGMITVFASEAEVSGRAARFGQRLSVAAINGPKNIVISGDVAALNELTSELERSGICVIGQSVFQPFHSNVADPIVDDLVLFARGMKFARPRLPWILTTTGRPVPVTGIDAQYWGQQMILPVRFGEALAACLELEGRRTFLEIGPHPMLLGMLNDLGEPCTELPLPSLLRGRGDWEQLLSSLAQLYVSGANVDWRGYDHGYHRCRVATPTYPFERTQYGRFLSSEIKTDRLKSSEHQPLRARDMLSSSAAPHDNCLYEVDWHTKSLGDYPLRDAVPLRTPQDIAAALSRSIQELVIKLDLDSYAKKLTLISKVAHGFVVSAFAALGESIEIGKVIYIDSLVQKLGITPTYSRLLRRLLEMLEEDGAVVRCSAESWRVISSLGSTDPVALSGRIESEFPAIGPELRMLCRCGVALPEVLLGNIGALELLFPLGSSESVATIYRDSIGAQAINSILKLVIGEAICDLQGGATFRVLEIGAGTGGATLSVLPQLAPNCSEYAYTDISPLFLSRAQQEFGSYEFVSYQLLDIERGPDTQGFHGSYDVVLAANVLHATASLTATLGHVTQLVAAGGLLVLAEGMGSNRFLDLTFGLTEGWWRCLGGGREYPLISAPEWTDLLTSVGFDQVVVLQPTEGLNQAVIVARKAKRSAAKPPHWLIFAEEAGAGLELVRKLNEHGTCSVVYPDAQFSDSGNGIYRINPARPDDYAIVLESCRSRERWPDGVIFSWGLNDEFSVGVTPPSRSLDICTSALLAIQAVVKTVPIQMSSTVWLITRGAQPICSMVPRFELATLWGLSKAAAVEHPDCSFVCIDLDPSNDSNLTAVVSEILAGARDCEIAFRKGRRYVSRLKSLADKPVTDARAQPVDVGGTNNKRMNRIVAEATYLVVGGLGGLGLLTSEWLVTQGARHLVIMGRSCPSLDAAVCIARWLSSGVDVRVRQADVGQRSEVAAVIAEIARTMPPLRGVVHSAGVLDDAVLAEQNAGRFGNVFLSKVRGAWNLHELTMDQPLDFFVLYSSVASLLGSPGQANHAAANAFLDSLAHYRHSCHLPALSINWGPWAGVGSAASKNIVARLALWGIDVLTPAAGMRVFAENIFTGRQQIAVVLFDAKRFAEKLANPIVRGYCDEIARGFVHRTELCLESPPLERNLAALREPERFSVIANQLCHKISRDLGVRVVDIVQPLNRSDIDSLMAIELKAILRREFGVEVALADLLNGASIDSLARWIADRHDAGIPQSAGEPLSTLKRAVVEGSGEEMVEGTL